MTYSFIPALNTTGITLSVTNLPSWASFNSSTGEISGTPTTDGTYSNIKIKAQKSTVTDTIGPFSITVIGDPLKAHAWHLKNTGQTAFSTTGGTIGADINLDETIAASITGTGIKIAVSDSGTEINHEDLRDRVISGASRNYTLSSPWIGDPTPPDLTDYTLAHGTAVAGLIAATGWNSLGSRGVAPTSLFAGFLYIGSNQTLSMTIDQSNGLFDIFNYSYGADSCEFSPIYTAHKDQIRWGTRNLRDGKGAIYVKAAGNEFEGDLGYCRSSYSGYSYYGNSNLEGMNSIPEILTVAALDANSYSSSYSSPGANLWVSAPGGEFGTNSPAMISTDFSGCTYGFSRTGSTQNSFEKGNAPNSGCNYTSTMNGTSSATPVTSGSIALLLSANPNLSWRDVKYILAKTATQIQPNIPAKNHPGGLDLVGHTYQQPWVRNGAGIYFHNWFGFGRVNVDAAVAMAKTYESQLGTYVETLNSTTSSAPSAWTYTSGTLSQSIPDKSATGTSSTINVLHNLQIESIEISLSLTHQDASDIGVELTSPSGTKSILMNINSSILETNLSDAHLLSNAFLDEMSAGNWTLKVIDGYADKTGTLTNWKIKINGHVAAGRPDITAPHAVTSVTHATSYASLTETPVINWPSSSSSDVRRYEISLGTSPGATNIVSWRSAALYNSGTLSGLSLTSGTRYYANIRVVDNWENMSGTTSSTGWIAGQ